MTIQVTATDAKAKLLSLLDDARGGQEIEITKHGQPVARLVPADNSETLEGCCRDIAASAASDEELFRTDSTWNAS
ncbi:MAG: type II toxin-antitoxin system Phd/YefM family antitoxin [Solirubrobacterales bacterium]|jgi:prevent-host-death family protein